MSKTLGVALFLGVLSMTAIAQGGEFELHPSLAVSEEFTDNVFDTGTNRTSDFITRLLPGVVASYRAPALTGDLDYLFDYRRYAKEHNEDEITHTLTAKGHLTAMENLLFLDVSDEYRRVSLDATRDVTKESLFVDQVDRNVITVSPYVTLHPTERIMLKPGYRFIDTHYYSSLGVDKTDHIGFLDMTYELKNRWSLTADYTFTRELAAIDDFSQHLALGGFRYEYADKSFVFAQGGYSWTQFESGRHLNSIVWNAGMTHVFDTATGTLTTGVRFNEDPQRNIIKESFVSGTIEKNFQRGKVSVSPYYSEYVLTETDVLETKKYGAAVQGLYELLPKLNGRLAITPEKFEQPLLGSYTLRTIVESGLSYLLAEQLTASVSYAYVGYYSPGIAADNRHVNRGMIEIKKIF